MDTKKYSQMSEGELRSSIANLMEKARKAEQMGMVSEYAVLERKAMMAKAYLTDISQFSEGEVYGIEGAPGEYFKVTYFNGVFAWGYRLHSSEEEGLPISLLKILK